MKPCILIVDDESRILQGLKRIFYTMQNGWDVLFVESGNEALKILEQKKIDIVISDMRMPEMDGITLLGAVKKKFPDIIRLILSGYSDRNDLVLTPRVAHRFLVKPCDSSVLKSTIEDLLNLKLKFNNEELLTVITSLDSLPSHQKFYEKFRKELNSPDVSIKTMGEILKMDVAMTAKVLQLVNSAFFGLSQKVTDPVYAISMLGLDVVRSLFLFVKIFSSFNVPDNSKTFFNYVYDHSFRVGTLAKQIAKGKSDNPKIADDSFISGLLHDIGKIIFLKIDGYLERIEKNMLEKKITFVESEKDLFGSEHGETGAYLLHLWGLPNEIISAVKYHHYPLDSNYEYFTTLSAVHIANSIINKRKPDSDYLLKINVNHETYLEKEPDYE